MAFLDIAPDML